MELTVALNNKGIMCLWLPDLQTERKFSYNTNIRHEDELGRDLGLKSVDQLCEEFRHCGDRLHLMLHNLIDGTQYIYYSSWIQTYRMEYINYICCITYISG